MVTGPAWYNVRLLVNVSSRTIALQLAMLLALNRPTRPLSPARSKRRLSTAKPDLGQPRAFPHQHGERPRADLSVERAVIARLDLIEAARAIGNHPGKDVKPAG